MILITRETFQGSTNLESITFSADLSKIDVGTFQNLDKLVIEDLSLENLTFLGNSAFQGTKIKRISNLGKITDAGIATFMNCTNLTEVTFPDVITIIKNSFFKNCINLSKVVIPSSLKEVWDSAFEGCTSYESIVLPGSIVSIGNGAFKNCTSMRNITILATNPPSIGPYNVFTNTNDCPIYVPATSVAAYKAATNWSNYASRIQAITD